MFSRSIEREQWKNPDANILKIIFRDHSFSTYAKFSKKINISNPMTNTRTCAYQE